jgi:fructokinase
MSASRLCVFGEVLFDHFPDGKRVLGGAPFNVAWHLQAFAQAPYFISRVGQDAEGESVRAAMRDWGMDLTGLQSDLQRATGQVDVTFVDGEPSYQIVEDCAYDAIDATLLDEVNFRLLYHGSLALRNPISSQAAASLRDCCRGTVFVDVNLRPPWWQREQVLAMLREADWVKLNSDELDLLYPAEKNSVSNLPSFLSEFGLQGVVLTHGSAGAEILAVGGEHFQIVPESRVEVVDTVGAGDAFASVIILGLSNDWPLSLSLQRAQEFASNIVGERGATVSDPTFYQPFIAAWQLDHKR